MAKRSWIMLAISLFAAVVVSLFIWPGSGSRLSDKDSRLIEAVISAMNDVDAVSVTNTRDYKEALRRLDAACSNLSMLDLQEREADFLSMEARSAHITRDSILMQWEMGQSTVSSENLARSGKDAFVAKYRQLSGQ